MLHSLGNITFKMSFHICIQYESRVDESTTHVDHTYQKVKIFNLHGRNSRGKLGSDILSIYIVIGCPLLMHSCFTLELLS
jgi:hypothetical protein